MKRIAHLVVLGMLALPGCTMVAGHGWFYCSLLKDSQIGPASVTRQPNGSIGLTLGGASSLVSPQTSSIVSGVAAAVIKVLATLPIVP